MDLLSAWKSWRPNAVPFVLREDWDILNSPRSAKANVFYRSWPRAYKDPEFPLRDSRLHLGLLPIPFLGDLQRASIYVLGLNPGVGPLDYYAEYKIPKYQKALLTNLKQAFGPNRLPFLFLDPQFAWHGGFDYWHGKLIGVMDRLTEEWGIPFAAVCAKM